MGGELTREGGIQATKSIYLIGLGKTMIFMIINELGWG
jgi:hypothetical protein